MTFLSDDEKTIVYTVLDMEYQITNEDARLYVESYVNDPNKILRLVAKDIAFDIVEDGVRRAEEEHGMRWNDGSTIY